MGVQALVLRGEVADFSRAMGPEAIPDQYDRSVELAHQGAQEFNHEWGVNALVGVQPEVQPDAVAARRHAKTRDN